MISFSSSNPLVQAISERNWAQVRAECSKRPKHARQWTRVKNQAGCNNNKSSSTRRVLPLHMAVRENAPLSVLEIMMHAYPQALTRGDSQEQQLPLHMACQEKKYDHKRIVSLLKHAPSACRYKDEEEQLPLHYALLARNDEPVSYMTVSRLLEAYPRAAACADKDGWLPLHRACVMAMNNNNNNTIANENAILMVVQELAEAYPQAIFMPVPTTGQSLSDMMKCRPRISVVLQEEAEMSTSSLPSSSTMEQEERKSLLHHQGSSPCGHSHHIMVIGKLSGRSNPAIATATAA